jgi:hypothetical protein
MAHVLGCVSISEATTWRALAGGRIYPGTAVMIERGLEQLEKEAV